MNESNIVTELRSALRCFANGVVILAARTPAGERHAMAATAVTPLSFAPPAMLACVNQSASIHAALKAGADFSINILSQNQRSLATLCSGATKGEARFVASNWREDESGLPFLVDSIASIICEAETSLAYGSHEIFIGRVKKIIRAAAGDPLIYHDGHYTSVTLQ